MTEEMKFKLKSYVFVIGIIAVLVFCIYAISSGFQYTNRLMKDCIADGNKEYVCYSLIYTNNAKR